MHHTTQAAPKLRVYELTRSAPSEIAVVESAVVGDEMQVICKVFGCFEVIHVNVGVWGTNCLVVFWMCAHYHRNNIIPKNKQSFYLF